MDSSRRIGKRVETFLRRGSVIIPVCRVLHLRRTQICERLIDGERVEPRTIRILRGRGAAAPMTRPGGRKVQL